MMIDARNKFKEGFIMTLRPFDFGDLPEPIQKMTIFWAHSEAPVYKKELKPDAKEKLDEIVFTSRKFFTPEEKEEWISVEIQKCFADSKNLNQVYQGDILQVYLNNKLVRLFPGEYKILDAERLQEIMQEEGYHTCTSAALLKNKDFLIKRHYLESRGISRRVASKWAALGFRDLVYYKPYYQLLEIFCRETEIYPDDFYQRVEGIPREAQEERWKTSIENQRK